MLCSDEMRGLWQAIDLGSDSGEEDLFPAAGPGRAGAMLDTQKVQIATLFDTQK